MVLSAAAPTSPSGLVVRGVGGVTKEGGKGGEGDSSSDCNAYLRVLTCRSLDRGCGRCGAVLHIWAARTTPAPTEGLVAQ